jgi:hypothetical protein
VPVFERLTHRIQRVPRKLEQLVQEEHAAMGETHLARPRTRSATNQPGD